MVELVGRRHAVSMFLAIGCSADAVPIDDVVQTTSGGPDTTSSTTTATTSAADESETTSDGSGTGSSEASSSEGSEESTSTGGELSVCGNGLLEPGEACDDGDRIDDDECTNGCELVAVLWTIGPDGFDDNSGEALDVAVDSNDDIIVTGVRRSIAGPFDTVTRKYDSEGELVWERDYSPSDQTGEQANAVATDASNNVVVVGLSLAINNVCASWVRMYDADGDDLWTREEFPAQGQAIAWDVAFDEAGDIVVVGTSTSADWTNIDAWVRKYSPEGDLLWTAEDEPGSLSSAAAWGVYIDGAAEITVVGSAGRMWRFDPDGSPLADDVLLANTDYNAGIDGIGTERIYVAGASFAPQARLTRLDGGVTAWSVDSAPNGGFAWYENVVVDSTGDVIVVGHEGTDLTFRAVMRKHDADGGEIWTRDYDSHADPAYAEYVSGVAVDSHDNVVAVGSGYGDAGAGWWIRKLTP